MVTHTFPAVVTALWVWLQGVEPHHTVEMEDVHPALGVGPVQYRELFVLEA